MNAWVMPDQEDEQEEEEEEEGRKECWVDV
jgi:hypothetical protein